MSLRDRLLRFKFLTGMLVFCLPPPCWFFSVCLLLLLATVLTFFVSANISYLEIPTNQHPRFLQQGRYNSPRKGWRFSQYLAQELQNHALFDVQYLRGREVQECLMQLFSTIILIQMNVGNVSKHENKSSYSN